MSVYFKGGCLIGFEVRFFVFEELKKCDLDRSTPVLFK